MNLRRYAEALPTGVVAAVLLAAMTLSALGQAAYTREEYDAYVQAHEGGIASLLAWLKENPDSALAQQYGIPGFPGLIGQLQNEGKHKEALAAGEEFLNEVEIGNQEVRKNVLFLVAWSAFYSQNYPKATQYGEQAYKVNPDKRLLAILARGFQQVGNQSKYVYYSEKLCGESAPSECFDLLPGLMKHYAAQKKWKTAAKWAQETVNALESIDPPSQLSSGEWEAYVQRETATAYTILGRAAFESRNWPGVKKNFSRAVSLDPSNKIRQAEASYYLAMSFWNEKKIDEAMASFAKCSVLGSDFAKACRTQLESLYKSTHNDSLQGLEQFVKDVTGK